MPFCSIELARSVFVFVDVCGVFFGRDETLREEFHARCCLELLPCGQDTKPDFTDAMVLCAVEA